MCIKLKLKTSWFWCVVRFILHKFESWWKYAIWHIYYCVIYTNVCNVGVQSDHSICKYILHSTFMYRVAVINKWRQIYVFRFSTLIEVNLIRIGSTNVYLFCGVRNLPQYHMLGIFTHTCIAYLALILWSYYKLEFESIIWTPLQTF